MAIGIHQVCAFVYVNECEFVTVHCGSLLLEFSTTTGRNALRVLPMVVVAGLLSVAATLLGAW